jgi:predicted GTPase
MPYGAAFVAATRAGATVVDPRPWAAPEIADVYARYPHLGPVLPATGYSPRQIEALRETIERASVDAIVAGTPADLAALLSISKPVVRARYEFAEVSEPGLWGEVQKFLGRGR